VSLQLIEKQDGKVLELAVNEKFTDSDFRSLEPAFYRLVKQHGKIRVLLQMVDFHGWEGVALWDEVRFDVKHFGEIERLAMVGDKKWEKFLSAFCRPFTTAEVRYFDKVAINEARAWLEN
jgi:hypothetical protein